MLFKSIKVKCNMLSNLILKSYISTEMILNINETLKIVLILENCNFYRVFKSRIFARTTGLISLYLLLAILKANAILTAI
jgi:hypothetical protein